MKTEIQLLALSLCLTAGAATTNFWGNTNTYPLVTPGTNDVIPIAQNGAERTTTFGAFLSSLDLSVLMAVTNIAQNAVANGLGVSVMNYGAVADGVTDSTVAIQNAITSNTFVTLPPGRFLVNSLTATNAVTIRGAGKSATALVFNPSATGWCINGQSNTVEIEDLTLDGGLTSTQSSVSNNLNRNGIFLCVTNKDSGVENCVIRGFAGIGVGMSGNQNLRVKTPKVSFTDIYYNYVGIQTRIGASGTAGEYSRIMGCSITENQFGVIVLSGNTVIAGNTISDNGWNMQILGDLNGGHGSLTGNLINHGINPGDSGLFIQDCLTGFSITGNQIWYGDIAIVRCAGLTIANNTISVANLHATNNNLANALDGNYFPQNPNTSQINYSSFRFSKNRKADGSYLNDAPVTWVPIYTNLVLNGVFTNTTYWTTGSGWSISGGLASVNGSGMLTQSLGVTLTNNQHYQISFTVSNYASGSYQFGLGGGDLTPVLSWGNGTYNLDFNPVSWIANSTLYVVPNGTCQFSLGNITVTPVNPLTASGLNNQAMPAVRNTTPIVTVNTNAATGINWGGTTVLAPGSTDSSGTVIVTAGAGTQPSNPVLFTNTFSTPFINTPVVFISCQMSNATSAADLLRGIYVASKTPTSFTVGVSGGGGLTSRLTYNFDYLVIGQ